ncbi:5-guanidino-2-oxopentanoate decarboxylase [Gymnodinialimonas ceratoperidinii]|uniref:5-guanidino-2-oxopentanoate decarboxylase n=1 Tax=Gymnodinialimonas ceratoperidinii TaxID=2856823 RepID=A0A8F6TXS9_9RHOB|nr:5-guanidino-2-oxopentanoate decarboxylase [Gymnodinialimonas ceratoperidinii]QXT40423.1 5-guanidino-2-oxopentanoate decarboxylase [Gymnodinialimonas ceratoperidinii]
MKRTVGEVLITLLERRGVDTIFGIPGVHTVEMYRGLDGSPIRHITPRHEQSAGFMADGYARATGKPGVCLLITGPGVTNAITPMAQARADSIPMLVISGVNRAETFGQEEGFLHELPDQQAMMAQVAVLSQTLHRGEDLERVVDRAFAAMTTGRPGPVHIEVPLDVMKQQIETPPERAAVETRRSPDAGEISDAAARLSAAKRPMILAGGGAVGAAEAIRSLAEALDAPVVTTTNARGVLGGHPLCIPASPSLPSVRQLMAEADAVLAIGTQFGRTDYDMYEDGKAPALSDLIRVDCDAVQITRGRLPDLAIVSDAHAAVSALVEAVTPRASEAAGAWLAETARKDALAELSAEYLSHIDVIDTITKALPDSRIVGDSTQVIYAGNMYADISQPRGWFNAATGYGALGYGPSAAIGAALGGAATPTVCITGDGGLQFCLSELGTAVDEETPVIFVVWNNHGYQEIERYMVDNQIVPEGVKPSAPDFVAVARAYGMAAERIEGEAGLADALARAAATGKSYLIEMIVP